MNDYILFRRHETSKARAIRINLCVQSDRKEKGRALIVFVEGQDSLRSSKSTQEIVTTTTALCIGPMDAVRLLKERVQGSRPASFPLLVCLVAAPLWQGLQRTACPMSVSSNAFMVLLNSVFINQKQRRKMVLNHWYKAAP